MRVTMDDGIALEVTDTGSGPGLLLVHGFGGAKEDFADHVDALAARHRVVTFDHRGHGESDGPPDPGAYSLDRMAADVLGVADAIGIDAFRLLGHSMGGMVARRVVLGAPERIDALVLMDTSAGPVPCLDPDLVDFMKRSGMYVPGVYEMPEVREVSPGHLVRSGGSSAFDVNFGYAAGAAAVALLAAGLSARTVVSVDGNRVSHMPTEKAIVHREVDVSGLARENPTSGNYSIELRRR